MGNLLTRRRELILSSSLPAWDYVWWYDSGKYPDQDGWTKTTSGTASEAFSDGYFTAKATNAGSYIQWTYPRTSSKGAMQLGFRFTTNNAARFDAYLGDGTSSSIGVRFNYVSATANRALYLITGSDYSSLTKLATVTYAKTYLFRLFFDNGIGEVWLQNTTDGGEMIKVADNVDCSTIVGNDSHGTSVKFEARASSTPKVNWYQARLRFNRTE